MVGVGVGVGVGVVVVVVAGGVERPGAGGGSRGGGGPPGAAPEEGQGVGEGEGGAHLGAGRHGRHGEEGGGGGQGPAAAGGALVLVGGGVGVVVVVVVVVVVLRRGRGHGRLLEAGEGGGVQVRQAGGGRETRRGGGRREDGAGVGQAREQRVRDDGATHRDVGRRLVRVLGAPPPLHLLRQEAVLLLVQPRVRVLLLRARAVGGGRLVSLGQPGQGGHGEDGLGRAEGGRDGGPTVTILPVAGGTVRRRARLRAAFLRRRPLARRGREGVT